MSRTTRLPVTSGSPTVRRTVPKLDSPLELDEMPAELCRDLAKQVLPCQEGS